MRPPEGYRIGVEFHQEQIDEALQTEGEERFRISRNQFFNTDHGAVQPPQISVIFYDQLPSFLLRGVEFHQEQIDEALQTEGEERFRQIPSRDVTGHGTAVAEIAAGNGMSSGGKYAGVAPQADLIVVKLGNPGQESFPRTTGVQNCHQCSRTAQIRLSYRYRKNTGSFLSPLHGKIKPFGHLHIFRRPI